MDKLGSFETTVPLEEKYLVSYQKALAFLSSQLNSADGMYKGETEVAQDLGTFYKFPMQLLMGGSNLMLLANKLLDSIKMQFLKADGDLLSYPKGKTGSLKTTNGPLAYFYPYINAWITMAAQRAYRFDVSQPTYKFLKQEFSHKSGGYLWMEPGQAKEKHEQSCCGFITAHLGLMDLIMGDLESAMKAGDFLEQLIEKQPDPKSFYLKTDLEGEVVTEFPTDVGAFFAVKTKDPNFRVYFLIGYPIIFLVKLHEATDETRYLQAAKKVAAFAMYCPDDIFSSDLAHKVAYGMALLWSKVKESQYRDFATKIADYLLTRQDATSGCFFKEKNLPDVLDQTAELIGWMREIYVELSR